MNVIKSIYITLYIGLLAIVSTYSVYKLYEQGVDSVWLGISLALIPSLLFFIRLFLLPLARTSANLNILLVFAVLGSLVSYVMASTYQDEMYVYLFSCGLGVTGLVLYIYWYSRFGRNESDQLSVGNPLPTFILSHANGEQWCSSELEHHPALILFFRGNWCPLCMAQIQEVVGLYKQFEDMGIHVYLVSPQPDHHTQALAQKFAVNFNFMQDQDNKAAKQLGIEALNGTPKGLELLGYDSDTVLPTVIMTDQSATIIFADQTDNYRVRPEPETFIRIFNEHSLRAD